MLTVNRSAFITSNSSCTSIVSLPSYSLHASHSELRKGSNFTIMKFPSNSDLTSIGEGDIRHGQSIDTCYGKRGKSKPLVSAVATFHSHASPTMTTCRLEVLPPIIFHIPWFSTDMGELIFGSTSYYAQIADRRCDLSLPSMI